MFSMRIQLALVAILTIASAIFVGGEYWGP
jgi:hypothetical protein